MKAIILAIPLLTMAFLLGCTEQSQITGPAAAAVSNTSVVKANSNIQDGFKFDKMVAGPGGMKYSVFGSVSYTLSFDGKVYSLSTSLNASINQSGGDNSWVVSSDKTFKSVLDQKGMGVVSESNDFAYIGKKFALYRLTLEYTIDNGMVTLTDVRIVSAKIIDDVKIID